MRVALPLVPGAVFLGFMVQAVGAPAAGARDPMADTWVATDALGRTLPDHAACGGPREGKQVGIFYFLWLGEHGAAQGKVHDITKILAANAKDPQWGPVHHFHHWGEPHLGYYRSRDRFVIRKHIQMLSDAGVDVLFCDVTNAFTYDAVVAELCGVLAEIRATGRVVPRIAFLTNSASAKTVQHLYDTVYKAGRFRESWCPWLGKPLLLAPVEGIGPEVLDFFTLRQSWAWTRRGGWFGDGKDKWPWVDDHPQGAGWHESPQKPEQISVCVAQHPTSNIGRSFSGGKQPPESQRRTAKGPCFEEQWARAHEVDPPFVFITGWNEWVAQRFVKGEKGGPGQMLGKPLKPGDTFFVDQFNEEYSRDIEPMRGGHGDNYYYQMVGHIRRFKGVRPRPRASSPKTIRIDGDFSQWGGVGSAFFDDLGDTAHRDHPGFGDTPPYVNATGRNDLDVMKVARDAGNLYFYARCRDVLSPATDADWMVLLVDSDANPKTGWEGYDLMVNRARREGGSATIERRSGSRWVLAGQAPFFASGAEMHLAVPRETLGLSGRPARIDFKWIDGVAPRDIMDFIDRGDAAPNGRFKYRYEE
ncbi:MAG TPA: hypothetical protein PLU30_20880 [Verrucomicrobiae bacterium]|nr:hypothetical protein [Verrucomicrobiae bacterium]